MRRSLLFAVSALLLLPGCPKPREWKAALASARAHGVIEVDARLNGDDRFCADVRDRMNAPNMVRCSPGADVSVHTNLDVEPPDHRWQSKHHLTEYVAAVYEVQNPAFEAAVHQFRSAHRALDRAEYELATATPRCDIEELEGKIARLHAARDRAEAVLDQTPRTVLEEEIATHAWTSVHHAWTSEFGWTATLAGAGSSLRRADSGDVVFRGVEQPGFEPAGIQPRRAIEPDQQRVLDAAYDRTTDGVARMLDEQLERVAALRELQCPPTPRWTDAPDWLECRAEVRLLRGEAPWRR